MDRRSFLRSGMVAGARIALASASVASLRPRAARAATGPPRPTRIGLLVPRSARCPHLGDGFLRGFEAFFDRPGRGPAPDLVVADVDRGFGGAEGTARAMLDGGQVDLVVAGVSAPVAARLRHLFGERRVPLVVSHVGATVPRTADRSPYVFTSSLGLWESSAAMGRWAASNIGTSCLVLASAFDSGFDVVDAFRLGFESAGGRAAGTFVTHVHTRSEAHSEAQPGRAAGDARGIAGPGLDGMASLVRRAAPDFVHAAYSGREALDFFGAWEESGLGRSLPLCCGGFAVEDYLLGRHGPGVAGAASALGWATGLAGLAGEGAGPAADVFSAMGHDAAALVAHAWDACGARFDPEVFLTALGDAKVDGARGQVRSDPAARHAVGPLYLRVVAAGPRGRHNDVAGLLDRPPGDIGQALAAAPATGWINEYLCA